MVSPDIVHVSAAAGTVTGIEAFLAFVTGFKQAFPDLRWKMREFIEGSDAVVAEGVFLGTNTGPMVGPGASIPATGRRVELPFCDIWKVSNGRLVENRIYYDQVTFLGQLGLLMFPQRADSLG
ncbi:MAG: ester cyclase [Thermoproteota archaeon]|nr:ester cyclase [Thermoproteota archaeon]